MRIIELEKRGQLAEAGAAHIVWESMEMRGKYLTELENASQLIRQQHDTSEAMTFVKMGYNCGKHAHSMFKTGRMRARKKWSN